MTDIQLQIIMNNIEIYGKLKTKLGMTSSNELLQCLDLHRQAQMYFEKIGFDIKEMSSIAVNKA